VLEWAKALAAERLTAPGFPKEFRAIASLELPGCFAMTEAGHGSDAQNLRTTATYDGEHDEFVIDTPDDEARKEYIGNAARDGRMAAVFAQLEVGGEGHGVHVLVLPLRDEHGNLCEGVRIEEDGRYSSPIESANRRFFTMLGALVQGRVCISGASVSAAKLALTIATRNGLRRRQFGPPGEDEVPILDYRTHQRRLMPLLAQT
jgi:acyl-CoA oxidase